LVASALLLGTLGGGAQATQKEDVTRLPGYVDFGALNLFGREEATVEIFLDGNLINLVASASRNTDPDLSDMLTRLKQIRVQSFQIDPDKLEDLQEKTAEVSHRLEGLGWTPVVRVRGGRKGTETYVYMKWLGQVVGGMVVMNVDPNDEASFVNIVGEIDPEQLGKITSKFHLDSLDSLDVHIKGGAKHDRDRDRDRDKR
jgi:hypothetical protein